MVARVMVETADLRAWLEATKQRGMSLGLQSTAAALKELRLPAPAYETVHVAGSNGKGTTIAALSAALSACSIDHVAFTSPHLVRVEERVRINGRPVSKEVFDEALRHVHQTVQRARIDLTFFETTFLVAMVVAARSSVQVLLLETGLGGRLDATRVADADVAVITSLSLEHASVLGDTLEAIAKEKAAIARPGKPLIVRQPTSASVQKGIEGCAKSAGNPDLGEKPQPAGLEWVLVDESGPYVEEAMQLANTAWNHLKACQQHPFPAFKSLQWPGRMQAVTSPKRPNLTFLLEGAHNPSGMEKSCAVLSSTKALNGPWILLFGTSPQQDMEAMLAPVVSLCNQCPPEAVVLTEPQFGRYPGVPREILAASFEEAGLPVDGTFKTAKESVDWLEANGLDGTTVVCLGSLYLQGNLLSALGADGDDLLAITAERFV